MSEMSVLCLVENPRHELWWRIYIMFASITTMRILSEAQTCSSPCLTCGTDNTCASCVDGYYLYSNKTCAPCSITGCLTCANQYSCTSCRKGKWSTMNIVFNNVALDATTIRAMSEMVSALAWTDIMAIIVCSNVRGIALIHVKKAMGHAYVNQDTLVIHAHVSVTLDAKTVIMIIIAQHAHLKNTANYVNFLVILTVMVPVIS
ncbi:hypothetical protein DPMN_073614 [Dreissena polymorpha]|uniref:Uncharacterized protein n=1 Tax=Dreissena polymorpha TaxID=45954 RepID=A0A9D4BZH1_DREPO|nr:hypothetical protein DPMN_073614 [Dreissena polymorpha]